MTARLRPVRSTVELEVRGPAPASTVWERYADLDAWASWSPQVCGVTAPTRRLAPGLRGRVHGPAGVSLPFTVTAVDHEQRSWSWRVRVGPVPLHLDHAVLGDGEGSRTTLRAHGWTPLVLGYAPLARLALGRLVRV